jgi:hypothetical protein
MESKPARRLAKSTFSRSSLNGWNSLSGAWPRSTHFHSRLCEPLALCSRLSSRWQTVARHCPPESPGRPITGPGRQSHPEGEIEQLADALEFNGPAVWLRQARVDLLQPGERCAHQSLRLPPSRVRSDMLECLGLALRARSGTIHPFEFSVDFVPKGTVLQHFRHSLPGSHLFPVPLPWSAQNGGGWLLIFATSAGNSFPPTLQSRQRAALLSKPSRSVAEYSSKETESTHKSGTSRIASLMASAACSHHRRLLSFWSPGVRAHRAQSTPEGRS